MRTTNLKECGGYISAILGRLGGLCVGAVICIVLFKSALKNIEGEPQITQITRIFNDKNKTLGTFGSTGSPFVVKIE